MESSLTSDAAPTKPHSQRSAQPRAPFRPLDPEQLRYLLCNEGHSYNSAAKLLGVCSHTVSVAAVRFGIITLGKHRKLDPQVCAQLRQALRRYAPVPQIAADFALSESSVYRFLRMNPDLAKDYKQGLLDREKLLRRMQFMRQAGSTRLTACADYYWLRRNDSIWMAQFIREQVQKHSRAPCLA